MSMNLRAMAEQAWIMTHGSNFTSKSKLTWREVASFLVAAKQKGLYLLTEFGAIDRNWGKGSQSSIPSDVYEFVPGIPVAFIPDGYYEIVLPDDFSDIEGAAKISPVGVYDDEKYIMIDANSRTVYLRTNPQGRIYCWRRNSVVQFASDPGPAVDLIYLSNPDTAEMTDETVLRFPDYMHQYILDEAAERIRLATAREDDKRNSGNDNIKP